ncbi:MAG: OsmC family protein [Pseudomonadota bacterium]
MANRFSLSLELINDYKFTVDFGGFGELITDEPKPAGGGEGPNPSRMLAASVANCLAASLLFALRKYDNDPGKVTADIEGQVERVEGRWRVTEIEVKLYLGKQQDCFEQLQTALDSFEDFCVVTQSVRNGVDVKVDVYDSNNTRLKHGD